MLHDLGLLPYLILNVYFSSNTKSKKVNVQHLRNLLGKMKGGYIASHSCT